VVRFNENYGKAVQDDTFLRLDSYTTGLTKLGRRLRQFAETNAKVRFTKVDFSKFSMVGGYSEAEEFKLIDNAQPSKSKSKTTTRYTVSLFCSLVNELSIRPKDDSETNPEYTKRICQSYDLDWTLKVAKEFGGCNTAKEREKLKKYILPNVDKETRRIISTHLRDKYQSEFMKPPPSSSEIFG